MNKTSMMALFTIAMICAVGVNHAFADVNKSPTGMDNKKKLVTKSFGWTTSKVCGLDICKDRSYSHLFSKGSGGYYFTYAPTFDGKFYIKGDLPLRK